jgi:hypothetical protein
MARSVGRSVGLAAGVSGARAVGRAGASEGGGERAVIGLGEIVEAAVERHRRGLMLEFGWTQLELRAEVDPPARALRLRGQVALPRLVTGLGSTLAPLLPAGWRVDSLGVSARPALGWRSTGAGVARLWRTPGLAQRTCLKGHVPEFHGLSCELLAEDGPVELLAEVHGCALVRAGDGTVGWLRGPLSVAREPARAVRRRPATEAALRRLGARLRGYLGVPYQLGGTTRRHIDCSGLVQRGVREALGLVLPRHSTDQLAIAGAPARALGEPGDLLFMTGEGPTRCHVGVVLRGARPGARSVVHASSRRGRVIEEPLDRCLARVSGVRHVELAQLLELRG